MAITLQVLFWLLNAASLGVNIALLLAYLPEFTFFKRSSLVINRKTGALQQQQKFVSARPSGSGGQTQRRVDLRLRLQKRKHDRLQTASHRAQAILYRMLRPAKFVGDTTMSRSLDEMQLGQPALLLGQTPQFLIKTLLQLRAQELFLWIVVVGRLGFVIRLLAPLAPDAIALLENDAAKPDRKSVV